MQTKTFRSFVVVILSASLLLSTTAQTPQPQTTDDWSAIKTLSQGDKIKVALRSGVTVTGLLIAADDVQLSLKADSREAKFKKESVRKVVLLKGAGRAETAVSVAAAGAGAGFKAGSEGKFRANGSCCDYPSIGSSVKAAAAGAIIGGLLGLAFGGRQAETVIYQARQTRQ